MHIVKCLKKKTTSVALSACTLFLQGDHVWVVLYAPTMTVTVHHFCYFLIRVSNMQCPFTAALTEKHFQTLSPLVPSYE